MMEKYAVRCGGGFNHRYGLYDAVMIKDNHISFAGSIAQAVEAVRSQLGHMVKIEVETETKEQVLEAAAAKVDCIMFDNTAPEQIKEWARLVPEGIVTEASGGITMDTLASYRDTGVDYISLGFLTHTVKAMDISVKVKL
jgi:nicotinate-nucleotide pyrophosphorylase (carboxylating)